MRSLGYSVREHSEHLARREVNGSYFYYGCHYARLEDSLPYPPLGKTEASE